MDEKTQALLENMLEASIQLTTALATFGINYREVLDAQDAAALEGREMNNDERKQFLDQAQSAVDQL